jgi:hypothetical protein
MGRQGAMTPRKAPSEINKTAMRQRAKIAGLFRDFVVVDGFLLYSFRFSWRLGVLAAI